MQTWKEFKRFHTNEEFYGCVRADGTWFDSATMFDTAVCWCAYDAGEFQLKRPKELLLWMATEGARLGYSIVHSSMLERMYERGLIK